jgi:hypothetical protein
MSGEDWVRIIGAVGAASVLIIAALGAVLAQVRATHNLVNGRLTQLLELTRSSSFAAGKLNITDEPPTSQEGITGHPRDTGGAGGGGRRFDPLPPQFPIN